MDDDLLLLAVDALRRLIDAPSPPESHPQLLAWQGDRVLLRTAAGNSAMTVTAARARYSQWGLSPLIDHTLLKADTHPAAIDRLCGEARDHGFASVCIEPCWVPRASAALAGSGVRVCTVAGFPLGANTSQAKAREASESLALGAHEVDVVLAIGMAKAGMWTEVAAEFRAVRRATEGAVLKLILETCLLTDDEKVHSCELAVAEGIDWVKTSTGFSTGGATEEDVALMRRAVGIRTGVKASGGIRTYAQALGMVRAGATRLGVSQSIAIAGGAGLSAS